MFKRLSAFLVAAVTAAALIPPTKAAAKAQELYEPIRPLRTYTTGQFQDVAYADWYAMSVQIAYEFNLIDGRGNSRFAPEGAMSVAEAAKVVSVLSSLSRTGKADFPAADPWHTPYIDYAVENGIFSTAPKHPSQSITRAAFAEMIYRALPASHLAPVNNVADGAIPDVALTDAYGPAVYALYRAGLLTGRDAFGRFYPNAPLSRAEAATILSRAASSEVRSRFTLSGIYTAEEIYTLCAPSVFYLERYNTEGALIGFGSGFFISEDGVAVTNYHVIKSAASASITTHDGAIYMISSVLGYDEDRNIAVVKINGTGFTPLRIGAAKNLAIGETVYSIGNPLTLRGSFSSGTVTGMNVEVNGQEHIQFSAPISVGNGGGPLINSRGEMVGLTSLMMSGGQNLNFAVPSDGIADVPLTEGQSLILLLSKTAGVSFYSYLYPAPDYGAFTGTPIYSTSYDPILGAKTYFYNMTDIPVPEDVAVDGYIALVKNLGFEENRTYTTKKGSATVYINEMYDMELHFGVDEIDGLVCRFVSIY
ncbi:MAG TPA: trypsin-like serine protease [Papillibacter sp.]|nr:trypsin-like serine protease [Papillibacter sp.]